MLDSHPLLGLTPPTIAESVELSHDIPRDNFVFKSKLMISNMIYSLKKSEGAPNSFLSDLASQISMQYYENLYSQQTVKHSL
jgi:hypothetical protein